MRPTRLLLCLCVLLGTIGCSGKPDPYEALTVVETPAGPGAAQPKFFVSGDEQLYLSWTEPVKDSLHALRYSHLLEKGWSDAQTLARGGDWFLHFADLPSMVTLSGGAVAGQWLKMNPAEPHAHDIQIKVSRDGGNTWSPTARPHKFRKAAEYGFVSMVPYASDRFLIFWLDGRGAPINTTLRMALVDDLGRVGKNGPLDDLVCDCCATDAALTDNGVVIAYRDRSPENWRDISVVRIEGGRKHEPQNVYPDRWRVMGCPVSGPSIDATGSDVAVAWYTEAHGPEIKLAFSANSGAYFERPLTISTKRVEPRVAVAMMADGSATVCWVERRGGNTGENLMAVRAWPDRKMTDPIEVVGGVKGLVGCLPQLARVGDRLVFAWTDPSQPTTVKTAIGRITE